MKHLKMIGLLVVAAASLMSFVSSASAASLLTSPLGTHYTGEIEASLTPGTSLSLSAGISDTCTASTVAGIVESNTATHAEGKFTTLDWGTTATPCTKTTHTLKLGKLTIKEDDKVYALENEVTVFDLGVSCVYGGGASPGTEIGTFTGGKPAELDINTTHLKKISGGFLCAAEGTWTGTYVVTFPTELYTT